MTININIGGKNDDKDKRIIEISKEKLIKGATHVAMLSFFGGEFNRIRPPRRNIGFVSNWVAALCLTDALMPIIFPEKEKEEDIVECENFSEVKDEEKTDD